MAPSPQKRRYWLLTSPRTASNLLVRMLNLDEQGLRPTYHGGYFFFTNVLCRIALFLKPVSEWTVADCQQANEDAKRCFGLLQDHIEASEAAGQKVFLKEHVGFMNSIYTEAAFMGAGEALLKDAQLSCDAMRGSTDLGHSVLNTTPMPDEFLKTFHPTFLIRHPALMLPSVFRTAVKGAKTNGVGRAKLEPYDIENTMEFVRRMYEFYVGHFGEGSQWPVVLDADDIMTTPALVAKYAEMVELDADKLCFEWEKASQETLDKMFPAEKIMLGFLNDSTKVDQGKVAGVVDIAAEAVKWREEFGEEGGRKLERWVREAMPDYEHLRARRLTL